jgi:Ca2+-binding RTX toxin-like protein
VSAQPGLAGTVRVSNGHVAFAATDQAANDLRLARRSGRLRFRDITAAITAGAGCTRVGPHVVTCNAQGIRSAALDLGPGADRVIVRAHVRVGTIEVQGGPGRDVIRSEGPSIRAAGGPGDDLIHGGPRADALRGGNGDDRLRPHGGADVVLGNDGDDLAVGGSGGDLIFGGADDDNLFGRTGDDILRGATGEDIVIDLHGTDRLYGGADPDYLNTKDGVTGDYENAGRGPDYGCAASPFPGDVTVFCDERAGPCCIIGKAPSDDVAFAIAVRRLIGAAMG